MPLNKKLKLLAQKVPELQTSRGFHTVCTGDSVVLCFEAVMCICCWSQVIAWCGPSHWVIPNFVFPNPFLHVIILIHWLPFLIILFTNPPGWLTHLHLQNRIYSILGKFKSWCKWKPSAIAACYSLFRGYTVVQQHKKTFSGKSDYSFWQSVF